MMPRVNPVWCGFLATAASAANLALLTIGTYPVDPLDIGALARLDAGAVPWLAASLVADLAFYLLLIPVALGLSAGRERWAGVAYALVGALGAVVLLWQWPGALYRADVAGFEAVTRLVYFGLWNGVGALMGGLWWGAVAWRTRHHHRAFAGFSLVLSTLAFLDAAAFRLLPADSAGLILMTLLAGLAVWPSAAALGPLRSAGKEEDAQVP